MYQYLCLINSRRLIYLFQTVCRCRWFLVLKGCVARWVVLVSTLGESFSSSTDLSVVQLLYQSNHLCEPSVHAMSYGGGQELFDARFREYIQALALPRELVELKYGWD